MATPSLRTVASRSLRFFLRSHLALVLGIAAATAVIVGALAVGDSVRGSLRSLVVQRLANIDCLLQARVFFDPSVVTTLVSDQADATIAPGIIFPSSTVEKRQDGNVTRASRVQLLAMAPTFWSHVTISEPPPTIEADQVILNQSLADELGVTVGDELSLRINQASGVSGDNPLGKKEGNNVSVPRQKVVAILPDTSVAGVSFLAGQTAPRNVFASLATIQDLLEVDSQVNAALVLRGSGAQETLTGQAQCDELNLSIRPRLEDYGLELTRHKREFPDPKLDPTSSQEQEPAVVYDYLQLSSKELVIDDATSTAVFNAIGREQSTRLITYLANSIAKVDPLPSDLAAARKATLTPPPARPANAPRLLPMTESQVPSQLAQEPADLPFLSREVPYSIVVGVDRDSPLKLEDYIQVPEDSLRHPFCWINSWLAEQLDLKPGEWFQADYFEPETVDGREVEKRNRFLVAGIVPVTEPSRGFDRRRAAAFATAPTIFNDPNLTPSVPGITDQDSISNWDLPFKLEKTIPPVDDLYWKNHRLTPKVFLPYTYAASDEMFGSRFGHTTAIRFSSEKSKDEAALRSEIEEALLTTRVNKGLAFLPIRDRQLAASSGTTPFDMLFLSLSFFVIVAALMLVFLLFRLGIQQRSSELGILLAQGFTPARVRRLLLLEFSGVAILGAALGVLLGLGYARLMIAGLESWWIGAIATRFLNFHVTAQSILLGALSGFLASIVAIYFGLRRLSRMNALTVLQGQLSDDSVSSKSASRVALAIAGFLAFGAAGLIVAGLGQAGMARAGSFFGSGMLLLGAALIAIRQSIQAGAAGSPTPNHGSLTQLAWKAVCRNPLRSSLSLSLLAVATFLITSMGVFQISPSEKGYGGFNLLAESSQPIFRDLGSPGVRTEALGEDARLLAGSTILPMRARLGEDASCNNLFQVAQPTILGVSLRLAEMHDFDNETAEFEWAATENAKNPWLPLAERASGSRRDPIPVILDQNTAAWSLKQGASLGAIVRIELSDQVLFFRTVGLLSNSVLQGKLLIDESNFEDAFPDISGYSFFMVRSGDSQEPAVVAQTLEKGWSDAGLDVTYSEDTLARLLGVQNTYISAFQSLGALGLLLGTFGLIAAQVRSVFERRREFALMRAVGFPPQRIARLLTIETAMLLIGGLITGILCASLALVPYVIQTGVQLSVLNPILMLLVVFLAGFIAAAIAVRVAAKQPVLAALRSQ